MHQLREGPASGLRPLEVEWLGVVDYGEGVALQARLVQERRSGAIADRLLFLEHPHVITLGTGSSREHVLVDADERRRLGLELVEAGRGGDVTYHGPGQLVGYPILDLKPDRKDLHRYLRDVEEALILALDDLGVSAHREPGLTGVWTSGGKVAALGVRVSSGWITSHGFALNVSTDLAFFRTIVPCGIEGRAVTSLEHELGGEVEPEAVRSVVARRFAGVFERRLVGGQTRAEGPGTEPVGPETPRKIPDV